MCCSLYLCWPLQQGSSLDSGDTSRNNPATLR
jgi:hypothetical protein